MVNACFGSRGLPFDFIMTPGFASRMPLRGASTARARSVGDSQAAVCRRASGTVGNRPAFARGPLECARLTILAVKPE